MYKIEITIKTYINSCTRYIVQNTLHHSQSNVYSRWAKFNLLLGFWVKNDPILNWSSINSNYFSISKILKRTVYDNQFYFCKHLNFPCIYYGIFFKIPRRWQFVIKIFVTLRVVIQSTSTLAWTLRSVSTYKIVVWFESNAQPSV